MSKTPAEAEDSTPTARRPLLTEVVDPDEVDLDEIDTERFRQLRGAITRMELDR